MKFVRTGRGIYRPVVAVEMQHGEPTMRVIGVGAKKLKKITKRQAAYAGPLGVLKRTTRQQTARRRFQQVESGQISGAVAAVLERDYAKEFARFRAAARRRAERSGKWESGRVGAGERVKG